MKRLIIACGVLLLSMPACAGEIFVGGGLAVSETPTYYPAGRDPLFLLRVGYQAPISPRWTIVIEAQHQSSVPDGHPFNDRPDNRQQNSLGMFVYRTFRIR